MPHSQSQKSNHSSDTGAVGDSVCVASIMRYNHPSERIAIQRMWCCQGLVNCMLYQLVLDGGTPFLGSTGVLVQMVRTSSRLVDIWAETNDIKLLIERLKMATMPKICICERWHSKWCCAELSSCRAEWHKKRPRFKKVVSEQFKCKSRKTLVYQQEQQQQ